MDVLKDEFFDDYADNRNGGNGGNRPNDIVPTPKPNTNGRPFPDEDYDKNGNLRKVRGRMLKKLLKYEFKAYINPMLIMFAALFGLSLALCVLGCFLTPEDFAYEAEDGTRMLVWIIALVIFIWVALASIFFPVGYATKRYHKQFFTSQGYLTLSIPASPEEHILAKRIAALVAMAVGTVAAFLAVIIAFIPVAEIAFADDGTTGEIIASSVNGWDVLYTILEILLTPILLITACCAFTCWQHRGLKKWMIVLLFVGLYFLSTVLTVAFVELALQIPPQAWERILIAGKWVVSVLKCLILYLLYRFETQTLRKKINLK